MRTHLEMVGFSLLRAAGFAGVLASTMLGRPEMSLAGPLNCNINPELCDEYTKGGGSPIPAQPPSPPATAPQAGTPGVPQGLPNEVWLADLVITLTGTKDLRNQSIVYQVTVTNLGDDDGRDITFSLAFSHTLPAGLKIVSMKSAQAKCQVYEAARGLPYVKCIQLGLGVGGASRVDVLVANPGNGPRKATAQVMGIVPDYNGANNSVTVVTP